MVFSGTAVTRGRGLAVVTAIAMQTEIGKIADMIQNVAPKETNLQKKLWKLSKWLGIVILAICAIVFLAYYFIDHESLIVAFLTAVALAVAAIPEWLPAVVTISLALGVKRMVKKNALMRRLSSVESLWSVDVICTDKTGTLTKNEMTVTKLWVDNQERKITGTGYEAKGEIRSLSWEKVSETVNRLLEIGTLCNQTSLQGRKVVGDPTEWCLLVSAAKAGIYKQNLEKKYIWLDEMPFDSSRKMMSSLYQNWNQKKLFSKGAPEILLQKCTHILLRGEVQKLDDHQKKEILKKNTSFAQDALRVLAFGYKEISSWIKESANDIAEDNLIFVGLQAMIDPPREEVKEAIQTCKEAGIRVIMITGDNIVTAQAIASELGIQGESLEWIALDDGVDIQKILQNTNIFARVNPEHKQKIIQALQNMWHVTAMTGDGVNDAPALKNADIGVAMWITGTDVSKEAADMILLDDNFATIVSAVEEWRGIFDNIRKFVNYMLSSNFGEVMVIFVMSILGLPLPLLAIQILWINLVTDGLPALALWVDPIDPHVMKRKPISPQQNILTSSMIFAIVMVGIVMTLGAYILFRQHYHIDLVQARTGVFVLLVLLEIVRIQLVRSQYGSKLLDNKRLLGAVGLSIGLVLLVVYTPLSIVFQTKPLSPVMWEQIGLILVGAVAVGSLLNLWTKRVGRRKEQATLR